MTLISDVQKQLEAWTEKKRRQMRYVPSAALVSAMGPAAGDAPDENLIMPRGLIVDDLHRFQKSITACGTAREFKITGDRKIRPTRSNSCGYKKYCKSCNNRDQMRRRRTITQARPLLQSAGAKYTYMITVTIPNTADIYEALQQFQRGWRAWCRMGQRGRGGEYAKIVGGLKSIEVKRGAGLGLQHVHAHCLVWASASLDYRVYNAEKKSGIITDIRKKYHREPTKEELFPAAETVVDGQPMSKISSEWYHATGGARNIHVTPVYRKRSKGRNSLDSAISECLKYALKVDEYGTESTLWGGGGFELLQALDALRGFRQVEFLGQLRGVEAIEKNEETRFRKEQRYEDAPDGFDGKAEYYLWNMTSPVQNLLNRITDRRRWEDRLKIWVRGVQRMRARIVGEYRSQRTAIREAIGSAPDCALVAATLRARARMESDLATLAKKVRASWRRLLNIYGSQGGLSCLN